jgi:hypothetical protein
MDEQTNNVGGSNMGVAPVGPSTVHDGQMQTAAGIPAAQNSANYYTQQPAATGLQGQPMAPAQALQNSSESNNDVSKTTVPNTAEDSDLIEKEWVEKAKAIVEKTRRDPFLQSQELNSFKTEYLHKRYGKNVGSGEH